MKGGKRKRKEEKKEDKRKKKGSRTYVLHTVAFMEEQLFGRNDETKRKKPEDYAEEETFYFSYTVGTRQEIFGWIDSNRFLLLKSSPSVLQP